jgi:hypothetical protein
MAHLTAILCGLPPSKGITIMEKVSDSEAIQIGTASHRQRLSKCVGTATHSSTKNLCYILGRDQPKYNRISNRASKPANKYGDTRSLSLTIHARRKRNEWTKSIIFYVLFQLNSQLITLET